MFALKVLFADENAAKEAISSIREAGMEKHADHPDYYAALQKLLQQPLRCSPAVFAEKDVISCEFYGFDEKESAMVEAAFLDVGALEVVVE
ncbi:hypothetical protein HF670_03020 [Acidithiobacillus thiooxidans]|jgi:hypothetical protein|uniref:Uncharacterized protein n=2 Tax=Acidithiobacillus thiooxidans TaxID=930 RepID=A0A1C2J8X7_ACITH|nr:hypothetical protein [Acidithiobacillus thiooxidans]MBU2838556.1 hypothetical protein [Acidithiobacillus thiooxidans]MBU2842964.1 hypothetical protein [Acidithiobacillus thiooxidans]MDX5933120.1 hypothetical protein [Acidithiobacillus thiooxidans]OCX68143.1 hypothetical protein A6M23_18880 [Acidithiobacillus thiooxidans]OCX72145.1 hypothetical protein A6P07_10625 [Acidithiobacillus thiooxidans]